MTPVATEVANWEGNNVVTHTLSDQQPQLNEIGFCSDTWKIIETVLENPDAIQQLVLT